MSGPGVYVPDVTEGITRVEDLPQPRIKLRSRNFSCRRCPFCGGRGGRWGVASRTVHDLGDPPSAADRSTCIFATPHIAVWPVVAPSLPISPTSPRSRASTPTGYNRRPCDW